MWASVFERDGSRRPCAQEAHAASADAATCKSPCHRDALRSWGGGRSPWPTHRGGQPAANIRAQARLPHRCVRPEKQPSPTPPRPSRGGGARGGARLPSGDLLGRHRRPVHGMNRQPEPPLCSRTVAPTQRPGRLRTVQSIRLGRAAAREVGPASADAHPKPVSTPPASDKPGLPRVSMPRPCTKRCYRVVRCSRG